MSDDGSVSIEEAYAEACAALGESVVMQRLLAKRLRLQAPEPASPSPEPSS